MPSFRRACVACTATGTITDNDNAAVTVEDVTAVEGVGLVFTVTLDKAVQGTFDVDVIFTDVDGNPVLASSDPENTDALFFIRLDSMENIDDVNGNGTILPSTAADIHWLIIPTPGSSNGLESGTLYYVGARLSYTIAGKEKVSEVTPDYIFVKPMPEIFLDYFLPIEVYGDDPPGFCISKSTCGDLLHNPSGGCHEDMGILPWTARCPENACNPQRPGHLNGC